MDFRIGDFVFGLWAFQSILAAKVSTHPVHVVDNNGNFYPSALIPFCQYGDRVSGLGIKIDKFDIPVCNAFRKVIYFDQICYEIYLQDYLTREEISKGLRTGLALLLDYNEDRQYLTEELKEEEEQNDNFMKYFGKSVTKNSVIYVGEKGI